MAVPREDNRSWTIEWIYSPSDFFEEPMALCHEVCELTIGEGKITAMIKPECGDPVPNIRDRLHKELYLVFKGAQLARRQTYELSQPIALGKGSTNTVVSLAGSIVAKCTLTGELRIIDKNGNTVFDSKGDRIAKQKHYAAMAAKHGDDDIAKKILQSHKMSIDDPDNSLVHLYEIRDAMSKRFGGDKAARQVLGISRKRWQTLGQLANDEPLKQGRHRGKNLSELRDATGDELKLARNISVEMIEKYWGYLERTSA